MIKVTRILLTAAAVALPCGLLSPAAFAQEAPGNGPNGMRPALHAPSRAHRVHRAAGYRPLTVVRRPRVEPSVAVAPPPAAPGSVVVAPVRAAGDIVDIPFRLLGNVFPATGSVETNPAVLIGAPIRAAGALAQVPFEIIEAPFAPSAPVTYIAPPVF